MSGETARADRLQRLLEVQAKKRQMEEWRLAELKREEHALAASSAEILRSLGDQSLLHGLFLDAKAATLRRNEVRVQANRAAQDIAAVKLRDAQSIEKRLGRASDDAKSLADRTAEKRALDLALDDYLTAVASFE